MKGQSLHKRLSGKVPRTERSMDEPNSSIIPSTQASIHSKITYLTNR